jgi:tRNA threonylcarbamoyl adenosine modification protein (Sua5/YciO/YrdC/YwlC family)
MLIQIHPDNPQARLISQVAACLKSGGVIIYPTDTIYGIGCDIFQHKAVEKLCRIKKIDPLKAQLSFICEDISQLSIYSKSIDTPLFRVIKKHLPGPFTFILPASKIVPKILHNKKSTVGLRIPDNRICKSILQELGNPMISASLPGEMVEDFTDPVIMHERFENEVDMVIDGGIGGMIPSTIVDCTKPEWEVTRSGLGHFEP